MRCRPAGRWLGVREYSTPGDKDAVESLLLLSGVVIEVDRFDRLGWMVTVLRVAVMPNRAVSVAYRPL